MKSFLCKHLKTKSPVFSPGDITERRDTPDFLFWVQTAVNIEEIDATLSRFWNRCKEVSVFLPSVGFILKKSNVEYVLDSTIFNKSFLRSLGILLSFSLYTSLAAKILPNLAPNKKCAD